MRSDTNLNDILKLLIPYNGDLKYHPVSIAVNSPSINTQECILPIELDKQDQLNSEENQSSLDDFFWMLIFDYSIFFISISLASL